MRYRITPMTPYSWALVDVDTRRFREFIAREYAEDYKAELSAGAEWSEMDDDGQWSRPLPDREEK